MTAKGFVRSVIATWRDGLINLTRSNRLLNFKPSRTGVIRLVRPSPEDVLARLARGGTYRFRSIQQKQANTDACSEPDNGAAVTGLPVPPPATDKLDTDKAPEDLVAALRVLYRRSNQDYLDRGVWVLYLAFGSLTWTDEDRFRYTSPLLLVPVQFESAGAAQGRELKLAPEEPVVNPALALKLSQYGIDLPRVDDLEEITLTGFLDAVRAAVASQDRWQVSDSLVLSYFSFAKEAMYRDLLDHEDQIAAHAVVAALASGGRGEASSKFFFEEIPEDEIDRHAAPESTPVILDADSSQRASIAAALAGRSFVMDGPPGTGKSQTIANMIGVMLHAGKTVPFVSEKAAALDVVRDRLDEAGLRAYLLELHSHKATRKQVAMALETALDTVPVPPAAMSAIDVDTARKRRDQLNAYAAAMNRRRGPLGYSLHDVLGMISALHNVPAAPATGMAPVDLTVEAFCEIRGTAERLSGVWRPASQGRTFVWRGVREHGSLDSRLYQAASSLDMLTGMAQVNAALAEAAGLTRPSDIGALAVLLDHLSRRPSGLPEDWLAAGTLGAVDAAVAELAGLLAEVAACEQDLGRAAGVAWRAVPSSAALPAADDAALATLVPPAAKLDSLSVAELHELSGRFAADADMLRERLGALNRLAGVLDITAPQTFQDARDLLTLAGIAEEPDRPERAWLSTPSVEAADHAAHVLYDAWQAVARAEADASTYYTPAVLREDVEGLASRFGGEHHGLGKLSGDYRADKKAVASFTAEGIAKEDAQQHLQLAIAWKRAADALSIVEAAHAATLGAYYAGRSTDWGRLSRALALAATATRAARGQDLGRAADLIGRDGVLNPAIARVVNDTIRDLQAWHAVLATGPRAAARPELLNATITDAISWLRAHLGPLHSAALFTHEVSEAIRYSLTVSQARYLVGLRDAADAAHSRLGDHDALFSDTFGSLYTGAQTDIDAVRSAVQWARSLRFMVTGTDAPLTPAQVKEADAAVPTSQLAVAADACGSVLILAGDQKQLPPSNFFAGTTADDEEEWSEDADDTAEFESILDHAKASGAFRSLTLRWHYRSMHEALIAFSNASFYKGQLVTFPSRQSDGPDVGVELFWVDGTYRRGSSRDNPEEAAVVAQRVIHHYDTRPALSLGVVTFSEAQAEAIDIAVGRARQDRPDLARFFASDRLRGFFVKSLESVQGDERDVLIFSIGYGPDENRKITMNFGPLNKQGGWRRLNVAITRARYRNEIISSIRASDIPESVTTEGLRHLRRYLDYAARGVPALALDTSAGGDAESPFEESVISVIRSWGYELTPQVGTAGYGIDIGVRHPDHPGVYALGVECDGYQYHSSKVARDRDRLREKVLRGLGWNLHRIWGTAWYRDRNGEEHKLRAAIEHAITAPVRGLLTDIAQPGQDARPMIQTEAATFDRAPAWATRYVTAEVPRLPHWIDPGQAGSHTSMAAGIRAVVMTEAPVHIAVLQQRLRDAWDIGRIGARIRDNIDAAIRIAGVLRDGEFLTLTSAPPATVRTPTDACRREVEHVHDNELTLALTNLVRDTGGITHDELTIRVARLYGWTRRGPDISTRLHTLIARLAANGTLTSSEHNLTVPS